MKRRSHRIQLPRNQRQPVYAYALSMALPGLGMVYAGRFLEAALVFAATLGVAAAAVYGLVPGWVYWLIHIAQAGYSWSRAGDSNTEEAARLYRRRRRARRQKTPTPGDEPGA